MTAVVRLLGKLGRWLSLLLCIPVVVIWIISYRTTVEAYLPPWGPFGPSGEILVIRGAFYFGYFNNVVRFGIGYIPCGFALVLLLAWPVTHYVVPRRRRARQPGFPIDRGTEHRAETPT